LDDTLNESCWNLDDVEKFETQGTLGACDREFLIVEARNNHAFPGKKLLEMTTRGERMTVMPVCQTYLLINRNGCLMSWKKWIPLFLGMVTVLVFGCRAQQPVYLFERGNMEGHYIGDAMRPEIPDTYVESIPEVTSAEAPLTIDNGTPREYWNLSLQETVRIALENGKVLRNLGGVSFGATGAMGTPSALLSNPYSVGTIYDPALVETDPRYGVEAALSAFDGQLNASAGWTKADEQQNTANSVLAFRPTVSQSDQGTFQATISKYAATGTTFYVRNNNAYDWSNATASREWGSNWSTYTEAGFTQALLRGRGVAYNRIAGPGAIPGYYNGVLIARISSEKSLVDFEMGVRKLVYDTENAYWSLYYAYRYYETVKSGLRASHETWRKVYSFYLAGDRRGTSQAEAQSRQQFYQFYTTTQNALSNIYKTEATLRYAMGIATADGRLIKPADEPSVAKIRFDWNEVLAEGLARAPELRKLKWDVKQRELELQASRNFLLPQLDFGASYRFNGMGHDLMNHADNSTSAYRSLTEGDYAGWNMQLTLNAPFGWRKEHAAVRNAELNLAKYRALLQEQELELSHNLADSLRDMDRYYSLAEGNFNRRTAAEAEVTSTDESFQVGNTTLDQVLDAQRRLAEAESAYFDALVNYNTSITRLHYLKGSLLEYDNVALAEGPWPGKAHFDAVKLARQRDAGHYINYGYTRPEVISRGVLRQFQNPQPQTNYSVPQPTLETGNGEVIYTEPSTTYHSNSQNNANPQYSINSQYNSPYMYETAMGTVAASQPVVGGVSQPVRSVNYQTNNTNNNAVFATAAPADNRYQQPTATTVTNQAVNPIAVGRINNSYR
jgi:outer membrane protein TolC